MDEEAYFFKIEKAGQANEYPVYIRDYMMNEDRLYANNFQEFLEHFFDILLKIVSLFITKKKWFANLSIRK